MAVFFTSSVYHGDTVEISTARTAQYHTRISKEDSTEHVLYIPNLGEFTGTDLEEIHTFFRQISGTVGLALWEHKADEITGNSGTR